MRVIGSSVVSVGSSRTPEEDLLGWPLTSGVVLFCFFVVVNFRVMVRVRVSYRVRV